MRNTILSISIIFLLSGIAIASTQKENFELQEKCSSDAERFFNKNYSNGQGDFYSCHYNQKLNKCFVYIKSLLNASGYTGNTFELYDANEGSLYASYRKIVEMGKNLKWDEITPKECDVEGVSCKSTVEFDNFIRHFLEE